MIAGAITMLFWDFSMTERTINEILNNSEPLGFDEWLSVRDALREARRLLERFNHTQGYVPPNFDWLAVAALLKKWEGE